MQSESTPQPSASNTSIYSTRPPKQNEGWRSVLSTILILIAAPLVALALTAFVFQSYAVDGPSMQNTLENQDRLIVLKVPRTWARITKHDYIPKRGDIVVFTKHNLEEYGAATGDKQLIKRVIGLPGDRVVINTGTVTIYNNQHQDGYNPDQDTGYSLSVQSTPGEVDVTVKAGEVFVAGDNRVNSRDSREFGPIPAKDIVGKLIMRLFPLNQTKVF